MVDLIHQPPDCSHRAGKSPLFNDGYENLHKPGPYLLDEDNEEHYLLYYRIIPS